MAEAAELVMDQLTEQKPPTKKQRKNYQCGWCKFRAVYSATVLRHHYRKHPMLEMDIVVMKHDGNGIQVSVQDSPSTLTSPSQLFCNTHLPEVMPSAKENSDVEVSDISVEPRSNVVKRDTHQAYVKCCDVMKSGFWYIDKLAQEFSISKVCLDPMAEAEFTDLANKFKHQVQFVDRRVELGAASVKDLDEFGYEDIVNLIREHD